MCCSCYTKRCCCGCMERVSGIKVMTIIDIIVHCICFYLLITFQQWLVIMGHIIEVLVILSFVADVLLLIAMSKFNGCFIAFWIIYRIMYIVGIFMTWIALGNVLYHDYERHDWEEEGPRVSWCVAWGCAILAIVILPFYNIHYLIVVKSYRKDNLSQENAPTPSVQYNARDTQVFIITRPAPYDIETGQELPGSDSRSPPPIYFSNLSNIQGGHQTNQLYPGGIEPLPPYYNKNSCI